MVDVTVAIFKRLEAMIQLFVAKDIDKVRWGKYTSVSKAMKFCEE
jgi:hypothetical protein